MSIETGKVLNPRNTLRRVGFMDDRSNTVLIKGPLSQRLASTFIELCDQVHDNDGTNLSKRGDGCLVSKINEIIQESDKPPVLKRPAIIKDENYIDGVLIDEKTGELRYFYVEIDPDQISKLKEQPVEAVKTVNEAASQKVYQPEGRMMDDSDESLELAKTVMTFLDGSLLNLQEGQRVEYESDPAGICEVKLYNGKGESNDSITVRFVRVTKILS